MVFFLTCLNKTLEKADCNYVKSNSTKRPGPVNSATIKRKCVGDKMIILWERPENSKQ